MSLLQMSFSGSVLILAIVVIRAIAINQLPKKIFLILWGVVLFRLLIPFSIPFMFSVYSVVERNTPDNIIISALEDNIIPVEPQQINEADGVQYLQENIVLFHVLPVIWCIGMIICAAFFVVPYIRCRMEFRTSLPVNEQYARQWLKKHQLRRTISIRQSDSISAPLTYGIFRPVILMPKKTDWQDVKQLEYVFLHEFVHICHWDSLTKLIATAALCIHWFNPLVWVMYILFNRDIELACDESVVRRLGEKSKSDYAIMLISMEAKKSSLIPLCNNFSKNAIEERITAIMKIKKSSLLSIIIGIMLVTTIITACATTAPNTQEKNTVSSQSEGDTEILSETTLDSTPFEVQIDKTSLQIRKEKETTIFIITDVADWSYTASATNGKISNIGDSSFTYTVPKNEEEKEDTITILISDYENGKQYEYNIPLIFSGNADGILTDDNFIEKNNK